MIIGLGTMMMTSCDEDQMIGMNLEGTWVGNMYMVTEWSGHTYKATESEITFTSDPFRNTKGYGYWVDRYSGYRWDYVANHIRWRVQNRTLYVYFEEDRYEIAIYDFRVNNNRFQGWIDSDDGESLKFDLVKVYDYEYDWDDYDYGWGYWDYYYNEWAKDGSAFIEFDMVEDAKQHSNNNNNNNNNNTAGSKDDKPIRHIVK